MGLFELSLCLCVCVVCVCVLCVCCVCVCVCVCGVCVRACVLDCLCHVFCYILCDGVGGGFFKTALILFTTNSDSVCVYCRLSLRNRAFCYFKMSNFA